MTYRRAFPKSCRGWKSNYGRNQVVLSKCGIDIRGRSRKLRVNYHTTEKIRRSAVALLEGCTVDDLEGGIDTQQDYKSLTHGDPPVHRHFSSAAQQADEIERLIKCWRDEGTPASSICIVARTHAELDDIADRLQARAITLRLIQTEEADSGIADSVRLATMHRAKGLEFDRVIVASVNHGLVPLPAAAETSDPVERTSHDLEERALLHVALTRARQSASLLSYGQAGEFLAGFKCCPASVAGEVAVLNRDTVPFGV